MVRRFQFDEQPSQTLAKGLMILDKFSTERAYWGVRELARELDMNPATVVRLVTTLENAGFLKQEPETQRYGLGPSLLELGNLYAHHNPLVRLAKDIFEQYSDRFAYNFYLGALENNHVIYLAAVDGRGPIKIVVTPGGSTGLHTTAIGKMLMAFQDDSWINHFLRTHTLTANTPQSITDEDELWSQLREIRQKGYAINVGEQFSDVGAIGVPVYNGRNDVVAGVSLAYPQMMLQDNQLGLDELVQMAREVARDISELYINQSTPLTLSTIKQTL